MRLKKLKRSRCVVLSLVLKRQWFILIENGTKKIEWRRADYWLDRVSAWFQKSQCDNLVPVVEFRHGYAANAPRMAFVCGWLWMRSKRRFIYCTPPYGWQSADTPVRHPQLGETPIERVAIHIGERVELVDDRKEARYEKAKRHRHNLIYWDRSSKCDRRRTVREHNRWRAEIRIAGKRHRARFRYYHEAEVWLCGMAAEAELLKSHKRRNDGETSSEILKAEGVQNEMA